MISFRHLPRRLVRQIANLIEESLPYLAAGDPARPPPPAAWFDAFRRDPGAWPRRRETSHGNTGAAGASFCCGTCT